MSNVYVLEPTRLDISGLSQHGHVKFVFDERSQRPSIWDPAYIRCAVARMQSMGYDPDCDYVAIVGHVACLVMLSTALAQLYPSAKVLYFSAPTREYVVRRLGITQETAA